MGMEMSQTAVRGQKLEVDVEMIPRHLPLLGLSAGYCWRCCLYWVFCVMLR